MNPAAHVRAAILAAAAALVLQLGASPPAASHGGTHQPTPPRLECSSPDTDHARACRRHRWIIKPRIHVSPHGYVRWLRADVPRCGEYVGSVEEQADAIQPATNCYWNHQRRGGGEPGESYVDLPRGWFMIVNGYRLGRNR